MPRYTPSLTSKVSCVLNIGEMLHMCSERRLPWSRKSRAVLLGACCVLVVRYVYKYRRDHPLCLKDRLIRTVCQYSLYYCGYSEVRFLLWLIGKGQRMLLQLWGDGGAVQSVSKQASGVQGSWINNCAAPDVVLLYMHGGGYSVGTADCYLLKLRQLTRLMQQRRGLRMACFSVEYGLAPECPYPEGMQDVERAWEHVLGAHGANEKCKFVVGGDSAGGGMAISLCLRQLQRKEVEYPPVVDSGPSRVASGAWQRRPDQLLLISPWVDVFGRHYEVQHESSDSITLATLVQMRELYLPKLTLGSGGAVGQQVLDHYRHMDIVHPVNAKQLARLPPSLVVYGGREIFRRGIELFVDRARADKGEGHVVVHMEEHQYHIFPLFPGNSRGDDALASMADALLVETKADQAAAFSC
jgi:acetyl esterase/lipase